MKKCLHAACVASYRYLAALHLSGQHHVFSGKIHHHLTAWSCKHATGFLQIRKSLDTCMHLWYILLHQDSPLSVQVQFTFFSTVTHNQHTAPSARALYRPGQTRMLQQNKAPVPLI